jgi:hypothetical protein
MKFLAAIYWDVITIVLPEPIPIFEEGGEQLVNVGRSPAEMQSGGTTI